MFPPFCSVCVFSLLFFSSFHFLAFHSSLDVFPLCVCGLPFFFICFLVFIHPFIPWMFSRCVCSFFSPFFFFRFLVSIHPSLDVFTLCAHVCFCLLFSISLLVCSHSSLDVFHPSVCTSCCCRCSRIALLLLLCCRCWFCLPERVGRRSFLVDLFSDGIFIFFPLSSVLGFVLNRIQKSSGSSPL